MFATRALSRSVAVAGLAAAALLTACSESGVVSPSRRAHVATPASSLTGLASIGDFVWADANGNGMWDLGELGMPNVTVNLYVGTTCSGAPVGSAVTDGNGLYYLNDIEPGTYSVAAVTPAGFAPTTPMAPGTTSATDSNPACSSITLVLDQEDRDFDYGFVVAPAGGQGCTPGYWKNHKVWPSPYTKTTLFSAVFDNAFPGKNLQQVLSLGGGGLNALGRHTVSALLNAQRLGASNFGMTAAGVISAFNAVYPGSDYTTLKDTFESMSDSNPAVVCPLN